MPAILIIRMLPNQPLGSVTISMDPNSMDIGIDLDGIPYDLPTMESQIPEAHSMGVKRLDRTGESIMGQ